MLNVLTFCLRQCLHHPASPTPARTKALVSKETVASTALVATATMGGSAKLVKASCSAKSDVRSGLDFFLTCLFAPWHHLRCSPNRLLRGQRRELQGCGQHDRERNRVPGLALQLHPGLQGGSLLCVLRLWWSAGQLLQVETRSFSHLRCQFSHSRGPSSLVLEW